MAITPTQALRLLEQAAFHFTIPGRSNYTLGTGFFFYRDHKCALAMTALHNVAHLKQDPNPKVEAKYNGETITLKPRWDLSSHDPSVDIAVLQLDNAPAGFNVETVPAKYLDPVYDKRQRCIFFQHASVTLMAYTCGFSPGMVTTWTLHGQIPGDNPIVEHTCPVSGVVRSALVISLASWSSHSLAGASGAPVLERDLLPDGDHAVVAVQWGQEVSNNETGSHTFGNLLYATEIGQLVGMRPALKQYVQPICAEPNIISPGVAVIVQLKGQQLASLVMLYIDGFLLRGATLSNDKTNYLSQMALTQIATLCRGLLDDSRLGQVLQQYHIGPDSIYGPPVFRLSDAEYEPDCEPALIQGMTAALIIRMLTDIFVYDIGTARRPLSRLIILAAGKHDRGFGQAEDVADSVATCLKQLEKNLLSQLSPVVVVPEGFADDVRRKLEAFGCVEVRTLSEQEDPISVVLDIFLEEAAEKAENHFRPLLDELITRVCETEKQCRLAATALMKPQQRINLLQIQLCSVKKQIEYLEEKIKEAEEARRPGAVPRMDYAQVMDELDTISQKAEKEATEQLLKGFGISKRDVETFARAELSKADPAKCKQLYHELARICHPDVSDIPTGPAWFVEIQDHYQSLDELFLEGRLYAWQPLHGVDLADTSGIQRAAQLFDRLIHLREVQKKLQSRLKELNDLITKAEQVRSGQAKDVSADEGADELAKQIERLKYECERKACELRDLLKGRTAA